MKNPFLSLIKTVRIRPLDAVILVIAAVAIGGFSYYALGQSGPARSAEIKSDEGTFLYPLSVDRTISVAGPLGESIIVIEDDHVHFVESPCRDKICIAAGELSHSGEWTACLPNRVFLTVTGSTAEGAPVDATAF